MSVRNLNLENFSSNTIFLKIFVIFTGFFYFLSLPIEKNINFCLFTVCFFSFPIIIFSLFNIFESTLFDNFKRNSLSFFLFILISLFILQQDIIVNIFDAIFFKEIDFKNAIFLYIGFLSNIINSSLVVASGIFLILVISEYIFSGFLFSIIKQKYDLKVLRIYAFLLVVSFALVRIFNMVIDGGLKVFE